MTAANLANILAEAKAICEGTSVACRYEYDRKVSAFRWNFYRHGMFVGGTTVASNVAAKARRLVK